MSSAKIHIITPAEAQAKIRGYMKVFGAMIIITALELAALGLTKVGVSHFVVTCIVVVLSCSKAFLVGYYFMHLNHETKWLKALAVLPAAVVMYAIVLCLEAPVAQVESPYLPLNPRVRTAAKHDQATEHSKEAAPAAPKSSEGAPATAPADAAPAPVENKNEESWN